MKLFCEEIFGDSTRLIVKVMLLRDFACENMYSFVLLKICQSSVYCSTYVRYIHNYI